NPDSRSSRSSPLPKRRQSIHRHLARRIQRAILKRSTETSQFFPHSSSFLVSQVENCACTLAETRTGRPVSVLIGHQRVRACDKSWRSRLRRISVKRSNVSRVALPTHVRSTTSSPSVAGVL